MIDIRSELSQNFLDFSYEANVQRAFANAADGLKPGQRACLWEMYVKKYNSNKPHVKSAKISGGVIATWWPHGDSAIYETFARMSQPWINNIPEVDWHGGNGSIQISGDPSASRYTEARLSKATEDGMFYSMNKKPVPMKLNFSEDEEWPEVLPAIFPRLMINGCQGIGSTLANYWAPNNLGELTEVIKNYVLNNELNYDNLAPDFPSAGIIINKNELKNIYATGKGKIVLRGRAEIKDKVICITELPYQVYVEPFIDQIKKLVVDDTISDIVRIDNKSGKNSLLIEIECEKDPYRTLRLLYSNSNLQKTYSPNQYALVGKTPTLLNLKDYLDVYINHNLTCIINEYTYDLTKAEKRLEIVNGLIKALENIDKIIQIIKESESAAAAEKNLMTAYDFTERQVKAIVDMKLGRLAKLEKIELEKEAQSLKETIENCKIIINNENKRKDIFLERLIAFGKKYASPRKTEVTNIDLSKSKEEKEIELIEPEKVVVTLTEDGCIKRIPASSFRAQRRNGKGVKNAGEITSSIIKTNTQDSLMIFSNKARLYRVLVNDIPEGTNTKKGVPVKSLIEMEFDENPILIYSIYRNTDAKYVLFVTKNGMVKKTPLEEYTQTRKKTGLAAIKLKEGDELVSVSLVNDENIILLTHGGMGIRIDSNEIGAAGRMTMGVKGITLKKDDYVVAALPIRHAEDQLAIISEIGVGKRLNLSDLICQGRAGKGLIVYKGGNVACAALVTDGDMILITGLTNNICIKADEIPVLGRGTSGSQLIKGTKVIGVSKV